MGMIGRGSGEVHGINVNESVRGNQVDGGIVDAISHGDLKRST